MAMLARQAWRMLISPDSMCAKVLKKHFPNSSQIKAQSASGILYSQISILRGVELLKEGILVMDHTSTYGWIRR
jgi:hypothetical protein